MSVILAENLIKLYGARRAVDEISFSVNKGEIFGLLGPNGAGKSTTMRMIACRSPLSGGKLWVADLDAARDPRRIRALIGVVPQENNLDPDLNVRENLFTYASYYRLAPQTIAERVGELLNFVGLSNRVGSRIEELSGGMKRRLMIARALLHRPQILLLDEPTTGLDPNVRQEIWEKLEELRREQQLTILLSTHYMDEAEKLCQRLLVLSGGKIVAEGVPAALVESQAGRYALEVRQAADLALPDALADGVRATERSGAHLFFAETPEQLTPLMSRYGSRPMLLRPANLEDVFLQITFDEQTVEHPSANN